MCIYIHTYIIYIYIYPNSSKYIASQSYNSSCQPHQLVTRPAYPGHTSHADLDASLQVGFAINRTLHTTRIDQMLLKDTLTYLFVYLLVVHPLLYYLSIHPSVHPSIYLPFFTYMLYTYTYRHISRTYDVPMCSHASSCRPVFLNFPWDYPRS